MRPLALRQEVIFSFPYFSSKEISESQTTESVLRSFSRISFFSEEVSRPPLEKAPEDFSRFPA